jgi:hypothetical protein
VCLQKRHDQIDDVLRGVLEAVMADSREPMHRRRRKQFTEHGERRLRTDHVERSSIRLLLPCVLGAKPVFHPCAEARSALRREAEKLDLKLHDLGESRRIVASLLHAIDANEVLLLGAPERRVRES